MFKAILFGLVISIQASALPLVPPGQFEGRANWKSTNGLKGYYRVTTEFALDQIKSTYSFPSGPVTIAMQTKMGVDGYFDVIVGGKKVGDGYCFSAQCHYSADIQGVLIEETLTYWQGSLYKLGSKKVQGNTITWEEDMQRVK